MSTLHKRWLLAIVLFLATLLAFASPAVAQGSVAEMQKHLVAGERAAANKKWGDALASFRKAHAAKASAATASRVANALYQLDRTLEAHDAYKSLLAEHGSLMFQKSKKQAADRLEELAEKFGTLSVTVSEPGAAIRVDDEDVGKSPLAAPVRLLVGPHSVRVSMRGFESYSEAVKVVAKREAKLDIKLKKALKLGTIVVKEKSGEKLRVLIDGKEVGETPYEGELEPGPHEFAGASDTLEAPAQEIVIEGGETTTVVLVAGAPVGTLEVRIEGEEGVIVIDGKKVGVGRYRGQLAAGKHKVAVERKGYERFEKTVEVVAADVHVETVSLRKSAAGDDVAAWEEGDWTFDGLYGGLQLLAQFQPVNTGHTMDDSCDATGATSCDPGTPLGAGIAGFIGWAFAPIGIELMVLASGDVVEPTASFDGQTGSSINPLVAQPAREEQFTIGRFGGGAALRARLLIPVDRFRFTGAIGIGFAYKYLLLARDSESVDGATSRVSADGADYFSPVMSIELGAQVRISGSTSFAIGGQLWLEHAGDGIETQPESDTVLTKSGEIPQAQATPAYDMASGSQLYIGPYLGFQFGP
jgi:hypothetical protein